MCESLASTHYCPYAVLYERNMPSEDNRDSLCHEETHLTMFVKFYFHKMYLSLKFRNTIQPDGKEKTWENLCVEQW